MVPSEPIRQQPSLRNDACQAERLVSLDPRETFIGRASQARSKDRPKEKLMHSRHTRTPGSSSFMPPCRVQTIALFGALQTSRAQTGRCGLQLGRGKVELWQPHNFRRPRLFRKSRTKPTEILRARLPTGSVGPSGLNAGLGRGHDQRPCL